MQATAVDLEALGRIGTALADETRRRLLVRLLDGPGYPAKLAGRLGLTKTNVSNHLACLHGLRAGGYDARRAPGSLRAADSRFAAALTQLTELALPPAQGCAHEGRRRTLLESRDG